MIYRRRYENTPSHSQRDDLPDVGWTGDKYPSRARGSGYNTLLYHMSSEGPEATAPRTDVWTETQTEPQPGRDTGLSWVANFLMVLNIIIPPPELPRIKMH